MNRICILTTSFPRFENDEASVFVKRLVEAFTRRNIGGYLIVPYDRAEAEQETLNTIEIHRYKYGLFTRGALAFGSGIVPNLRSNPLLILQAPMLMAGLLWHAATRRKDYSLVHANWITCALPAWANKLLTGKPYVITLRGEDVRLLKNPLLKLLFRLPIRSASFIVSVNESFLEAVADHYPIPSERLVFIPNGVEVAEVSEAALLKFCEEKEFDPKARYLLFIGSVIPRKRPHLLIELLAASELSDYQLIIAGRRLDRTYSAQIESRAEELGVRDRVRLTGKIPPSEVPCLLKLSRYYVTASEHEGRSNSTLEALAAKRVVLVSNIDAHREFLVDGMNSIIFNVNDIPALAEKIAELDRDNDLRERIAANGYEFTQEFSWERAAERYAELFHSTLSHSQAK